RAFEAWIARQRRRLALAEIGEDQADVFFHRITRNADFVRERLSFRRLLDALSRAVIFPAMIKTTYAFALDPAHRKLRSPVRAARANEVRRGAIAAIDREIFSKDSNRQRPANRKLMGAADRLPEHSQIASGQCSRTGVNYFAKIHFDLSVCHYSCFQCARMEDLLG